MPPERWRTVRRLLEMTLDQPVEHRTRWLKQACRGDDALRQEVLSLLQAHDAAGQFIEQPVVRLEITTSQALNGP